MNAPASTDPPAAHPARRHRLRPLAKAAAAFFLLNALLSAEIPCPRMDWGSLLRLSPESLGLLLGMGAPVHVLQTGDDVNAIVQIVSVAVMDAMGRAGNGKAVKKAPAKKSKK